MVEITSIPDYEDKAMRTAKTFSGKTFSASEMDLLHAALGLASDSGEFVTAIKAYAIYGKTLDVDNCIEELGDCLWFIALACKAFGIDMVSVMEANIAKLAKRYPEKYSDEAAIARADKVADTLPDDYEVN